MILLFCTFPLWIQKIAFPDPFGTSIPPKSLPKRLPRRPSGPKMASKPSLGPPRWPSRQAPSSPNRLPDRPRANFGGPGTLQAPILAARDPFCLQFGGPERHFGRSNTNFPAPKHPFSSPDFPLPRTSLPTSLSKPFQTFPNLSLPNLQASKHPSLQASEASAGIAKRKQLLKHRYIFCKMNAP